jgi:hypothetical protein
MLREGFASLLNAILGGQAVPDTVAGEYYERIGGLSGNRAHLRVAGDLLLGEGQLSGALVLEIAERARQIKTAVHSIFFYKAASSLNSGLLGGIVGLVVVTEGEAHLRATGSTQYHA